MRLNELMTRGLAFLPAVACALSLATAADASTLINGGFESSAYPSSSSYHRPTPGSTEIDGWEVTLDGVEYFKPAAFGLAAHEGEWVIDLAYYTSSRSGGIRQTLDTTPGQALQRDFALGTHTGSGRVGTAEVELPIDGVLAETFVVEHAAPSIGWTEFELAALATGPTTTIEFRNRQDANRHFAYLDAAAVTVVPEPAAASLTGVAGLFALRRRRR